MADFSVKRGFDLLLGITLLVPAVVILLPLMTMIRLGSPGPAVFRQERVGRYGMPFILFKLRTMYADTMDLPSNQASAHQVTRIGRFLRRTKLDELPQLFNVMKGEMSFVGPRPCLPSQVDLVAERNARGVLEIRPGITGWAQIKGIDMSQASRLAIADAEYLGRRSFLSDLRILAKTFFGSGSGDAIK